MRNGDIEDVTLAALKSELESSLAATRAQTEKTLAQARALQEVVNRQAAEIENLQAKLKRRNERIRSLETDKLIAQRTITDLQDRLELESNSELLDDDMD